MLERYFKLAENQTTVRQEMLGGLTTFMTMAYVIVVNPQILAQAGMPIEGVLFATCISSAAATLVMGLYANYPIALAPGMSLNAYFTYSVCLGMHIPWQTALGVVFFSGVLVRASHRVARARADRQRHSRLPEAFDGRGYRHVHRVCRLEERENRRRESGDIREHRQAFATAKCKLPASA